MARDSSKEFKREKGTGRFAEALVGRGDGSPEYESRISPHPCPACRCRRAWMDGGLQGIMSSEETNNEGR